MALERITRFNNQHLMSDYFKNKKIFDNKLASCYIYWLKPGGRESNHYHRALEIEYVLKGNCKTHKQGKLLIHKPGLIHEVINDSNHQIIFLCLTIPREITKNTIYI